MHIKRFSKKSTAVIITLLVVISSVFFPLVSNAIESTVTETITDASLVETQASDSVISGKKPALAYASIDGTNSGMRNVEMQQSARLTDGTVSSGHADIYYAKSAGVGSCKNMYLAWQLDNYTEITGFLLYNNSTGDSAFNQASYEVYVARDIASLFESGNLAYTYVAPVNSAVKGQNVKLGTLDKKSGYYVGVRITDGCSHADKATECIAAYCDGARIGEIAFYGTPDTSKKKSYTENTYYNSGWQYGYDTDADSDYTYAKSILNPANNTTVAVENGSGKNFACLSDGNYTNQTEIWKESGATVTYTLKNRNKISALSYWHNSPSRKDSYEVYVGDDNGSLYESSNLIYKWDGKTSPMSMRQMVTFDAGKAPIGKYIGFKFTDGDVTTESGQCRIAEIAAWGSVDSTGAYAESTDAATVAKYIEDYKSFNLVSAKSIMAGYAYNSDNSLRFVEGQNMSRFTNNSLSDRHGDIYNAANSRLVWQLDAVSEIDHFVLYNQTSASATQEASYKIYVGNDMQSLFNDSNMRYEHTARSGSYKAAQLINLGSGATGRFVGIIITNSGAADDDARISEIGFYGTPDLSTSGKYKLNTYFNYYSRAFSTQYPYADSVIKGVSGTYGTDKTVTGLTDGTFNEVELYNATDLSITYTLPRRTAVHAIQYWHSQNLSNHDSYNIYVSNSKESLFNEGNKVFTWNVKDNPVSCSQLVEFNSDSYPAGQYVGIRYTEPSVGWDADTEARAAELGIWGEEVAAITFETEATVEDMTNLAGKDLIAGKLPVYSYINTDGTVLNQKASSVGTSNNPARNLTDNATPTSNSHADIGNAANTRIAYALDSYSGVTNFLLYNRSEGTSEAGYKVFVGNSLETLFADTNCIYTHTPGVFSRAQLVTFDKTYKGYYVGVEFTVSGSGDGVARINEIAFYGTAATGGKEVKYTLDANGNSNSDKKYGSELTYDTSLIKGKQASVGSSSTGKLTDGSFAEYEFYNAVDGKITFTLTNTSAISALGYWQSKYDSTALKDSYKVFVSEDLSALYNDDNLVFAWDANNNATSVSQIVKFKTGKEPIGKYVGILLTDPSIGSASDTEARISEFGVWGQTAPGRDKVNTAITVQNAADWHSGSLIAGLSASTTLSGSTGWKAGITDGTADYYKPSSSWHDIYSATSGALVYKLKYESQITAFALWQTCPNLKVSYDVYVGYSTTTLYDSSNLVFTWNCNENLLSSGQRIDFSTDKTIKGKYVAIKFTGYNSDDCARLAEIGVYGSYISTDDSGDNTALSSAEIASLFESNLLAGRIPETTLTGARILTGELSDGNDRECMFYAADNGTLLYDLGHPTAVSSVATWMSSATRRVSYKIFLGNDKSSLFDDANMVYEWDAMADAQSLGQMYSFNSSAPVTARYVGWLFTDADSSGSYPTDPNANIARITELYVSGKQDYSTEDANLSIQSSDVPILAEGNLLSGIVPTVNGQEADNSVATLMTDGSVSGGGVALTDNTKITYYLGRSANIESILVSADKSIAEYDIYTSDDISTLYYSTNRQYSFKNSAAGNEIQKVNCDVVEKSYVGIIVRSACFDNTANNINEIIVSGEFNSYIIKYPDKNITTTNYGTANILGGIEPTIYTLDGILHKNTKGKDSPFYVNSNKNWKLLTDDKVGNNDHTDLYFAENGVTITFALGQKYDISQIALYNARFYLLGEYEVFVSNSLSTLYNPENLVLNYTNRNMSWAQDVSFCEGCHPVGKFVGFRFPTCNVNAPADSILRLSEVAVLGTPYIAQPTNLSTSARVTGYVTKSGKITELTQSQFTTKQRALFTNSANTEPIAVSCNGGKLSFVIDLCAQMNLNKLVFANIDDTSKYIGGFNIYAADYIDRVWDSDTLAYTYVKSATDGKVVEINKDITARYLRIDVTDPGSDDGMFYIQYFTAIGLDSQTLDVANQLYGIDKGNISYYSQNNDTYSWDSIFNSYNIKYICDSYNAVGASVWGASYDNESLNIVFKFNNTKMLNKVNIGMLVDRNYETRDMQVYLANSINSLMDKSASPVGSYSSAGGTNSNCTYTDAGDGVNADVEFNFDYTEALYLRIRINDSCSKISARDTKMAVLTEVKATGVDTANVESESGSYAATFSDTATGITLSFDKLNENDVYRTLTRMTVEQTQPSNKQQEKIESYGFVPYSNMYKIHLYDYLGNEVSDFSGRNITISVPIPAGLSMAYLAGYYDGEFDLLNSGFEGNNIVYTIPEVIPKLEFVVVYNGESAPSVYDGSSPSNSNSSNNNYVNNNNTVNQDTDNDTDAEVNAPSSTRKKVKKTIKIIEEGLSGTTIALIIAGGVVVAAGIAVSVTVIIKKRKQLKK